MVMDTTLIIEFQFLQVNTIPIQDREDSINNLGLGMFLLLLSFVPFHSFLFFHRNDAHPLLLF
jgi:hypothetical protein